MVQLYKQNITGGPPAPVTLNQENFGRGVISLIDESKLPRNALKQADNLTLAEDGSPTVRPGVAYYGDDLGEVIDGCDMFMNTTTEAPHLVAVADGVVKRSTDNGATWDACTGATMTVGKKVFMVQANEFLYLINGWDNIVRYDGSTDLQTYDALDTPTGGMVAKTGLATASIYTYRYRVSAVNAVGYTIASVAVTIVVDRTRESWDDTNYVTFSWSAVTGATRYDIYTGQTAGEEAYIDSVEGNTTTTYIDKGQAVEQVAVIAPDSNTTSGPRVGNMTLVGTRLYATKDRDFPYRVWISGAGRYIGQFSSAYEATYIDLQKGGQERPVCVKEYRDGKGTPLATVWCKSKDGRGAIWQGTLESMTIGDVTFPVPNFYKLPGSRGTDAPESVVNVMNDYMYYNSQAFYNLGSRAQFLNLLSTDEVSANIRPDVKSINQAQSHKIAAHFQDAKVYFSVPMNQAADNDTTIIFDTERKAWLPRAFTIGFERFFPYTDTDGDRRLLCWRPGDTQLSQISDRINGDYGEAFQTSLVTGLIHVNPKNRFEFMWCEEVEVEFAQPRGQITVELSGITREEGFKQISERIIEPTLSKYSWTTFAWTTRPWTDTDAEVHVFSEPSMKRYSNVQEDLNAYQFRVSTDSLEGDYILRTLQVNGTATQAGKPREWELYE